MKLIQKLEKKIGGWWDGGAKDTFEWTLEGSPRQDAKGQFVRVGSWDANHWFHVAAGRTEKQTLGNARRHLSATFRRRGLACSFEYEN